MMSLCTVTREFARNSSRPLRSHDCYRGLSFVKSQSPLSSPSIMTLLLIYLVGFRSRSRILAAQNFTMPAMSPTMTEGNIASWKVKEGKQSAMSHNTSLVMVLISDLAGDSFSTGDILLEIETDKAQMEVEAQDDGTMVKITVLVPAPKFQ